MHSVVGRPPTVPPGCTPGTGRRPGPTWTADSNWRPSPSTSERRRPPLRETCAPFLRCIRSGRWRWADNCCPPSVLRQKPKQRTQTLCTRSSVPSAAPSCDVWGSAKALTHHKPKPGTRPHEHARRHHQDHRAPPDTAHACPARCDRSPVVAGHHADQRTLQEPAGHCGRYETTLRCANVTPAPRRPPADGETTGHPWDCLTPPETPTMGVKPAAKGSAISRNDPRQANLAREGPPQNLTTHGRAAHPADACRSDAPARVALGYPTSAARAHECGPALAALQPVLLSTDTNPMAPPNPFLPRIPGEGHALRAPAIHQRQGTGRRLDTDLSSRLTSLSHKPDARWTKKCSPTHGTHGPANEHGIITRSPGRRVMRDPATSEHIILENVTSKGRGSKDVCATRADTHILRESYTPRHQVTGRPQLHHWGNFSASTLRECCDGHVPRSPESYQRQGA